MRPFNSFTACSLDASMGAAPDVGVGARITPPSPPRSQGSAAPATGLERTHPIDVAHLAAGLGFALAVEVDAGLGLAGVARPGVGLLAQQVQHLDLGDGAGGAQGPAD